MQIGNAWTKTETKQDGSKSVTGISITLDDTVTEIYPQLKNVRFSLKPLTPEQRTKDNSPHWRVTMYKPSSTLSGAADGEAIPF